MLDKYNNKTIVFFGDSITDTCKNYDKNYPYGAGYVNMVKADIDISYLNNNIKIYNEGIGGNKTEDLIARLEADVLSKNPDLVFMLIGINDIWHLYDRNEVPNIKEIIGRIDYLINKINSKVVLLTPFLFPNCEYFYNMMPYFNDLMDNLYQYINDNNIEYIDIYKRLKENNNINLTKDCVHPTIYGHAIIAQSIMEYLYK